MRIISLLAVTAVLLASPAGAAIVDTRDVPADLGSLTIEQRATRLPPETKVVFRGKTTTLSALRTAHAALLAHFANLGALKRTMPPFVHVPMTTKRVGAVSAGTPAPFARVNNVGSTNSAGTTVVTNPIVGPAGFAPGQQPPRLLTHVPNAAPQPQPIDYTAVCGKISLCIYLPPAQSFDLISFYVGAQNVLRVQDPLLSESVCVQDGGVFNAAAYGGCLLTYMTSATISVSPGNPPDLQSSVNCAGNGAFTVAIDPLGAAAITGNINVLDQPGAAAGSFCAVDLMTP